MLVSVKLVLFGPGHPYRGGIARTTSELVRALRRRGHEVEFFAPRRQYPRWLYPGGDDRDPAACPALPGTRTELDPLAPWRWHRVRRAAQAVRANAWVVPYWTWAWAGWWRSLLGASQRPPTVAVVHNPADHGAGPVRRLAARSVLSRCHALFTHARSLSRHLEAEYPGVPVASHPIPPFELTELPERGPARRLLDLPERRRVALFLGLIRPYKGVEVLLEAFSRVPDRERWCLVVAGEPWGGLGDRLRRMVRELDLEGVVRLELRWIPEPEVPTLLAAADVVVLPYRSGSQSAVAPIALASGVPVVASAVGGLPEVVEDGVNGVLVEPGSVEALVRAINGLDRERLTGLTVGARAWRGTVTWDSYAAALEDLLARVVEPPR
jgi:glycosyltransferase involved in cell wall biosynthesis